MLKIGELAQLCGVDVQTLRYYDKLGILSPDRVDSDSGYRYYSPEKEKDFRLITELKELGFSLKEIKTFLCSSEEEQKALYAKRRQALKEQIRRGKENLRRIDHSCATPTERTVPFHFFGTPFENDPAVIGKWAFCGVLPEGADFTGEAALLPKDIPLKELFFLPGGAHVWNYFWTRGILFVLFEREGICLSNEYRVFSYHGEEYMAIRWQADHHMNSEIPSETRIYRQIDRRVYTEKQTFRYKDEVDLPFVPDPDVVGVWEAFDRIESPDALSATPHVKETSQLFFREIAFSDRGACYKLIPNSSGGARLFYSYTDGLVLDREMSFAEPYEIRTLYGEDYLILSHKSGDYAYLGKVFCYYVFKRKKEEL